MAVLKYLIILLRNLYTLFYIFQISGLHNSNDSGLTWIKTMKNWNKIPKDSIFWRKQLSLSLTEITMTTASPPINLSQGLWKELLWWSMHKRSKAYIKDSTVWMWWFFFTHTALKMMTTGTKSGGQTTNNLRPAGYTALLLKVTIRNADNKSKNGKWQIWITV